MNAATISQMQKVVEDNMLKLQIALYNKDPRAQQLANNIQSLNRMIAVAKKQRRK